MSSPTPSDRTEGVTRDQPAIGLVDSGEPDAIAGAILRARERGYHSFLVTPTQDSRAARFAREIGASVVTHEDRTTNGERLTHLHRAARKQGFPGVIRHDEPTRRIDYERSTHALWNSEEYIVSAELESVVEFESGVLVGIPAYNEAGSIGSVVQAARAHADEVVVVDDGSDDETPRVAREAGATVVEHDRNRGYGAALKTAFREAERSTAEHLVILDADGQHDASDVPRLVERQRETEAEVVIGSRFDEDSETDLPLYRRFGLGVVNALTNLSLGAVRSRSRVKDTQSGFRCYSREAIESLASAESIGDHMGASTDILHHAHAENYDIEEVGTTVRYDVENGSEHNPLRHGLTLVSNLLTTIEQERPVLILGVPGFVLASLGIGFGYWTFSTFLNSGTFPIGLAVTSVFFTLIGVFSGFTAIILHALAQYLGSPNGAS
jgi:glycosyltransferase involved in cell wall biosynthesis